MSQQKKAVSQILLPSWLSGLLGAAISIVFVLAIVGLADYKGSELQLLKASQASHSVHDNYQALDTHYANTWVSNIPLLIFWAGVGLVAYSFVTKLSNGFKEFDELRHEMDYVHADRKAITREAVSHLLIRLVVLAVWLVYIRLTVKVLLPYTSALAYVGEGFSSVARDAGYLVLDILLVAIILHLHVVLFRMLLLRTRAYGGIYYT